MLAKIGDNAAKILARGIFWNFSRCHHQARRWMEKGCAKGRSRQLKRLFTGGCVTDAEMQQAAGVTVTNVRACQRVHNGLILISNLAFMNNGLILIGFQVGQCNFQ